MNPFLEGVDPAHYDRARPYFHPPVIRRFTEFLQGRTIRAALDVACGTGHSTQALAEAAEFVVGLDASIAMLRLARSRCVVPYVIGLAEQLPFPDETFDLVSVAMGFHWFDRDPFFREAHRVLRRPGWLLLYDFGFAGRMKENPAFVGWVEEYRRRFPPPPRNRQPLSPELLAEVGLREALSDTLIFTETYDFEQLVAYLKSQSNMFFAQHEGRETSETISSWLRDTLAPMFRGPTGTFEYQGWVHVLERSA